MYIRDFLETGKTCRVCSNTESKTISVCPYILNMDMDPTIKDTSIAEIKDNKLTFKIGSAEAYTLFSFNVDEHKAERKMHNPKHSDLLYANTFKFILSCSNCNSYRLESSLITFHPMGSLTSNIYVDSEKVIVREDDNVFIIKNLINENKVLISYSYNHNFGIIDLPFLKMKNLPVKSRAKMLRKLRTLMLLS